MKLPTLGMLLGVHSARILVLAVASVLIANSMLAIQGQSTSSGSTSQTKGPHAVQIEDQVKYLRYAEPQRKPHGKSGG